MIKDFGPDKVSDAVHRIFRDNIRKTRNEDGIYPPYLRATIVTYLFNLSPKTYYSRIINLKMHIGKKGRRSFVVFNILKPATKEIEEVRGPDHICQLLTTSEIEMASAILDFNKPSGDTMNFSKEDLAGKYKFRSSYPKLSEQVHLDSLSIFRQLELALPEEKSEKMVIKALRDLRVANSVINQEVDYGFMSLYGIGRNKYRFLTNNMFGKEMEDFFMDKYGERTADAFDASFMDR